MYRPALGDVYYVSLAAYGYHTKALQALVCA
jgi:hypothetical protein